MIVPENYLEQLYQKVQKLLGPLRKTAYIRYCHAVLLRSPPYIWLQLLWSHWPLCLLYKRIFKSLVRFLMLESMLKEDGGIIIFYIPPSSHVKKCKLFSNLNSVAWENRRINVSFLRWWMRRWTHKFTENIICLNHGNKLFFLGRAQWCKRHRESYNGHDISMFELWKNKSLALASLNNKVSLTNPIHGSSVRKWS